MVEPLLDTYISDKVMSMPTAIFVLLTPLLAILVCFSLFQGMYIGDRSPVGFLPITGIVSLRVIDL